VADARETLTYELFGTASRELAEQVAADGYEPELILSIARGGLDLPVVLPPTLDRVDITGSRVLVADDVADTGKTLELVRDFCTGYVAEVRTAVIYEKPQSVVQCDYVWRRTDRWINFPWSMLPPVVRRSDRPGH
jgi:hypoxanthine phosphoribosyltransferase